MKKTLSLILCLALVFSLGTAALAADTDFVRAADITYRGISIVVNDTKIVPQDANGNPVEPFIMDGTTFLPVRAIAGALGLYVDWDGATNTVILTSGAPLNTGSGRALATNATKHVDITFRDIKITLDGYTLEPTNAAGEVIEPFILDGTTYLPVRGIANALGAEVEWDAATSTVRLTAAAGENQGGGAQGGEGDIYVLVKETQVSTGDGGYSSTTVTTHDYYPNGLERTVNTVYDDGTTWSLTNYYDDSGNLTRYVNNDGETRYSYNSDGWLIKAVATGSYAYTCDYTYDSSYNLTAIRTVYSDGTVSDSSYTYDAYGNDLSYDYYYADGSGWSREHTAYYYDTEGRQTMSVSDYSGDSYAYTDTTHYYYDGWQLVRAETVDTNTTSRTDYSYDANGNLIGERYYFEGELENRCEYAYDAAGNMIRYTFYGPGYTTVNTYEYALMSVTA